MARTESRTKTGIWAKEEFCALTKDAQRLYWLLYSQSTISLCGVVAYTPGRWARMAADDTVDAIERSLHELERAGFIVVDWTTEEVFVRSFMRNDGVWRSPKTRSGALLAAAGVLSVTIRKAIEAETRRLLDETPDSSSDGISTVSG